MFPTHKTAQTAYQGCFTHLKRKTSLTFLLRGDANLLLVKRNYTQTLPLDGPFGSGPSEDNDDQYDDDKDIFIDDDGGL